MVVMTKKKEIIEEFRKKGYRITPQREQILELFLELPEGDHLSAEELQTILQDGDVSISLATLYRTLNFLSENGFLRELDFGEDHKHYEITTNQYHHHLICNKCGVTIEFNNNKVINLAKNVAEEQNNFKVLDYQLKIFGLCQNCQNSI
ncbi:MAG: hypothetical protein A2287_03625 [Candidatus Melainabacteria bacterium RIFOXYA12_FULL_32_12]|nr:MAG: hypothetical protein A2104_09835 [Candidatus Melainabacteria bacterium GWF2_32_7]OGI22818.1 MAG: hypothetical protein A2255_05920 [Candidatus Melainabacteria bacterium RIFOXYA2_FULL_32_9]OGI24168.1 MAG: hypothetical protein A2287_03625 [Candidatus Melainabacteria bacterium RIFOXYA12_FULL_32_12]